MILIRRSAPQPQPTYPIDRAALERDCRVEFVIASGPGGQHRNKTESGVRLTHEPSGIVVMATERRSQHQNREVAFERMAEKLENLQRVQAPRIATRPSKAIRARVLDAKKRRGTLKRLRAERSRAEE